MPFLEIFSPSSYRCSAAAQREQAARPPRTPSTSQQRPGDTAARMTPSHTRTGAPPGAATYPAGAGQPARSEPRFPAPPALPTPEAAEPNPRLGRSPSKKETVVTSAPLPPSIFILGPAASRQLPVAEPAARTALGGVREAAAGCRLRHSLRGTPAAAGTAGSGRPPRWAPCLARPPAGLASRQQEGEKSPF